MLIRQTDAELLTYADNFYTVASVTPEAYGFTVVMMNTLEDLKTAYETALTRAQNADTRTTPNVTAKNQAKKNLQENLRLLVSVVNGQASVTDAQKQSLRIHIRKPTNTPIKPPEVPPDVDIVSVDGNTVNVRLHSSVTLRRGARPAGVAGATIFQCISPTMPGPDAEWVYVGSTSGKLITIAFDAELPPGTIVWITAYYTNPRQQSGVAATPVSTRLNGSDGMKTLYPRISDAA